MKTLMLATVAAAALSGCAVYPAYPTYGPYGGTYVAPAPVYVYPSFGLSYGYGPRVGVYGGYGAYGGYGRHGHYARPYGGYGYRR